MATLLCFFISLKVEATALNASVIVSKRPLDISALLFSSTLMKRGKEKTAHQTATERKDHRMASLCEDNPNQAGFKYIKTLITNNNPPPR